MPVYKFKGRTFKEGSVVVSEEHAVSERALAQRLHSRGIFPVVIREKSSGASPGKGFRSPGCRELALFTDHFSVMLRAGLPVGQCLAVLGQQARRPGLRVLLGRIKEDVESGSTLSDALRRHPAAFDTLFTDMIEAGEMGGFLDEAFKRLSVYLRRAVQLKQQILAASLYPLIVTAVAAITVSMILVWVVPVFVSLFEGLDVPLPMPTRIVIWVSNWTGRLTVPFCLLVAASAVGLKCLRRRPEGQLLLDRVLLGLPLLGGALGKVAIARFALTLATLLRSGVPLLKGLEITAATSGNSVFRRALNRVRQDISTGGTVCESMERLNVFPPLVTRMVAVGERAGELDRMLDHLASVYEEESEAAISQLMTALEPTLVVVLGVLVGGIVMAMYWPIFSLFEQIAR